MATLRGGGGMEVLKMYYVVCDWSLMFCLENENNKVQKVYGMGKEMVNVQFLLNKTWPQKGLIFRQRSWNSRFIK